MLNTYSGMKQSDKIYVAGHSGLVGSALVRLLQAHGFINLITRSRAEVDLRDEGAVRDFFAEEAHHEIVVTSAAEDGAELRRVEKNGLEDGTGVVRQSAGDRQVERDAIIAVAKGIEMIGDSSDGVDLFRRAGFNGLTNFLSVWFKKESSFSRAYFRMGTGFSGSRFDGISDFSEAVFEKAVFFMNAVFGAPVNAYRASLGLPAVNSSVAFGSSTSVFHSVTSRFG